MVERSMRRFPSVLSKACMRLALVAMVLMPSYLDAGQFRIGYLNSTFSHRNAKDINIAMEVWIKELLKDLPHQVTFSFYDDPKEMARLMKAGKLDYVLTENINFIRYFDAGDLVDAFGGGSKKRSDDEYVIVVRKAPEKQSWKRLKDAAVSVRTNDQEAELYVRYALLKCGNRRTVDFKPAKTYQRALLDLFFGKVDVAVVTRKSFNLAAEMNPQMVQALTIMEATGFYARLSGFFRKDLDEAFRKEISDTAMHIDNDERGRQVMLIYQTEKVVPSHLKDLEPLRKLDASYRELLQQHKE